MKTKTTHAKQALCFAALLAAPFFSACGEDEAAVSPYEEPVSCTSGKSHPAIVTKLAFTRVNPPGVAPGFDLDGKVSNGTDDESCTRPDFVDEEGRPGVDNQLAALIPDIEAVVGNAVDGLVQGAINDGQLLIMLEMTGVDDMKSDPCTGLAFQLALGKPFLGTDGVLEPFQTFALNEASPRNVTAQGKIEKGVMTAGPFDVALPLKLFDVSFTLNIQKARFRFKIDDQGGLDGYLSGGIIIEELLAGVSQGAGVDKILPVIKLALNGAADLAKDPVDGKCKQLSATIAFKAAPAFIRLPGYQLGRPGAARERPRSGRAPSSPDAPAGRVVWSPLRWCRQRALRTNGSRRCSRGRWTRSSAKSWSRTSSPATRAGGRSRPRTTRVTSSPPAIGSAGT